VLVCTTIIESGIDMPTVNTLVVDRADLLGLGQLHQLRGRVGRAVSGPTPTCSTPRGPVLTEEAYERLKTIGEATELGSGFKIAMRDLEIRGAGNLLGEASPATSPPSATTCTARWSPRPSPR
jgi:transcription-repair coupling factor (superfamily II helicase)